LVTVPQSSQLVQDVNSATTYFSQGNIYDRSCRSSPGGIRFADKYLLTSITAATVGSKFGPRNKFGSFPVFGGWKISDESFMQRAVCLSSN
jgi:hypothetical protein